MNNSINSKTITPIAYIKNDFKEKFGIPRQSGRAPSVLSKIIFLPKFRNADALRGIKDFSHLWLLFDFSLIEEHEFSPLVRPPRLGGNKKVGVFASRSPFRPNGIGLSSVKLIDVIFDGEDSPYLIVSGADLADQTPIYDVKPYLPITDCHPCAVGSFSDQNSTHKLSVYISEEIKKDIPPEKLQPLCECLSDDPRPSYQDDNREYGMKFADFNVKFKVENNILSVIKIEKL